VAKKKSRSCRLEKDYDVKGLFGTSRNKGVYRISPHERGRGKKGSNEYGAISKKALRPDYLRRRKGQTPL